MTYTSGPWKRDGLKVIAETRGTICVCPVVTLGGVFNVDANVDLIAAAPDLVVACKMAQFLFVEGNDVFEGLQEATAYMKKTKVALDKALAKCNCREGLDNGK